MTKHELDFSTWFENVQAFVLDGCGVDFSDDASVLDDYEAGKNCADVAEEIIHEYTR